MNAELELMAARKDRPLQPLKLEEILRASSSLPRLAELLHVELPVRFARRIKHLQRIPGWERIPELVTLHDMHLESFRELRLASPEVLELYAQAISQIRLRHGSITQLFAEALQRVDRSADGHLAEVSSLGDDCSEAQVQRRHLERWAETFLNSRVSTEIQMSHFVACTKMQASPPVSSEGAAGRIGVFDTQLDLRDICDQAIAEVQGGQWPCAVEVEHVGDDFRFCHSPRYLFYILVELLKNSSHATRLAVGTGRGGAWRDEAASRPIRVTVCAGDHKAVLRISDRGGGIPCDMVDKMWWFTSCSPTQVPEVSADGAAEERAPGAHDRPWGVFGGTSPLAGRGMGLPLSRAYAKYLSSSLEVIDLPNLGVDAFLFLDRIDFQGIGR